MKYNAPFGVADLNAGYINGDPSAGRQGSIPPASSIEYPQREIVDVIQWAYDHGYRDLNNALCNAPDNGDLTQLRKAIWGMIKSQQLILTAPMDIYVDQVRGNDAIYDGLYAIPAGSHGPFATMSKALSKAALYAPGTGYPITIHVSSGTYYGAWSTASWAFAPLTITGAGIGSTLFTSSSINSTCNLNGPNQISLQNCDVQNTSGAVNSGCVCSGPGGTGSSIDNVRHIGSPNGTFISAFLGTWCWPLRVTLAGNGSAAFSAQGVGATINMSNTYCTCGPCYYSAFAEADTLGAIGTRSNDQWARFVSPENITGTKFSVSYNAVIRMLGAGVNFFPGSSPGVADTATGGRYEG